MLFFFLSRYNIIYIERFRKHPTYMSIKDIGKDEGDRNVNRAAYIKNRTRRWAYVHLYIM